MIPSQGAHDGPDTGESVQKRVLIVEDEPAIRDMVAFALRKAGMEAVHAADARSAQTAIGDRIPAFASSTGRALLARLPDDEVRTLYPAGFTSPSETAPRDMGDLLDRLAQIREEGFAESRDEAVRGVRALSVAVGDPATGDEVALCLSFPAATVEPAERVAIIRSLGEGAAGIAALTHDNRFYPLNISTP